MAALLAVQIIAMLMPQATGDGAQFKFAMNAMAVYLVLTALAWLIDRQPVRKGSRRR